MAVLGNRVIKSIQRGSTTVSASAVGSDSQTATASITAVDTSKSFISASCKNGYGSANAGSSSGEEAVSSAVTAGATLTNSTTITCTCGGYRYYNDSHGSQSPIVYWEVIEYV